MMLVCGGLSSTWGVGRGSGGHRMSMSTFEDLLARPERLARSTLRAYQFRLKGFFGVPVRSALPVVGDLRARVRSRAWALFDGRNLVAHLDEFEGDPRRRPLTVDELEACFAACEARIERCRAPAEGVVASAARSGAVQNEVCVAAACGGRDAGHRRLPTASEASGVRRVRTGARYASGSSPPPACNSLPTRSR